MSESSSSSSRRRGTRLARRRDRVLALSAAGVILAGGVGVASFAAWNDIEWITGGAGTGGSITASRFNVEQFALGDTDFDDYETQGQANRIDFGTAAAALTPGDTVYAYVRLRTSTGSLGGSLTLAPNTTVVTDQLSDVATYGARFVADAASCASAGYGASTDVLVAAGSKLDAGGSGPFSLAAATSSAPGAEKVLCFAISLAQSQASNKTIQGQTIAPLWHFDAVSVATP